MAKSAKLRVFSYDVRDDRRRRRVAKILEDVGTRVQYSVFEARLTDKMLDTVVRRALKAIAEEDSLRVYSIGGPAEKKCNVYGASIPIDNAAGFWLL